MRSSEHPSDSASDPVPSGELSSTTRTCAAGATTCTSERSRGRFPASLKVGTTTSEPNPDEASDTTRFTGRPLGRTHL